ncbi:MAG TPA: FAD-dependent oxidoreductase [Leptolyngbyaceae cyanobacterium M65_K2018_010]|nr:FAD-dependent oxidoreductase [Leptolyngbyaceae cyanobacterium M65_K2018_010]
MSSSPAGEWASRLASRSQTARIAIVGGGLAGLNAAYQLQKVGLPATLYEAKARVGGRIQSRPGLVMPGLVNDLGAAFINSDHYDVLSLVQELGLELFDRRCLTETSPLPEMAFFFAGRRIDPAELAFTLAPLATQVAHDQQRLAENFDRYAPRLDALSVADYLDLHGQKMRQGYGRSLIEASIRTEYGVEADQASALQLLYNLPQVRGQRVDPLAADELFTVKGGSGLIPQRLAAHLGDGVQTGWRLQAVTQVGEGFQLRFTQGSVAADYVILALPFPALRRIDLQVPLPDGLRQFIQEGGPGRNEKLFAGFSQRPWLGANGFTGAAWSDMGYSGLWEDTQRQPEYPQGVLTFFLGGNEVPAADGGIQTQGQGFVDQLGIYLPDLGASVTHRYARTAWGQDPDFGGSYTNFRPGQYTRFRDFLYAEATPPGQGRGAQVGNLLFAGEQFSEAYYGYMNGAAQTGRLAAAALTQRLLAT